LFQQTGKGNPFIVNCTYLKFNLSLGTKKTKDLLGTLIKNGKKNPDLFEIKVIQKFLIYHDKALWPVKV
jgi:hypothetical protein